MIIICFAAMDATENECIFCVCEVVQVSINCSAAIMLCLSHSGMSNLFSILLLYPYGW
jgi:hypothetical protein